MAKRKPTAKDMEIAANFLQLADSFIVGDTNDLDIIAAVKDPRGRLVITGLVHRLIALRNFIVEKKLKSVLGSIPHEAIRQKLSRKEMFAKAYQRHRIGRSHRGAVLLAMKDAGVLERTAWNYVKELKLTKSEK